MKNNKTITYSQVGDNYETKDPVKKLTQEAASKTSINLKKSGFKEISDTRGESAFVWNQNGTLMASVIEGLGTKNLIADGMRKITGKTYYDVIGHDTVATIINDLSTVGAKPLVIHAYWAIEDNAWLEDKKRMTDLINGWKGACDLAGVTWGGGETATMKQIVVSEVCELAGSAVGIISSPRNLIIDKKLQDKDRILLLKSNGVNANGISLTRAIADRLPKGYGTKLSNNQTVPNNDGYFGVYGGQLVPPALKPALDEISREYAKAKKDPSFKAEYLSLLKDYVGRPSPLFLAKNLTQKYGGAKIYLKREDLNHTGAHKINHTLGEVLLAKRMGKKKVLAETGAGQHGVALATAAALLGLECEIHMGQIDVVKQHPNVLRMKMLGARIVTVKKGGRSLKEAVDSAFTTYLKEYSTTFFAIGSVVGPHPYPMMVRDFQAIVGQEARQQIMEKEHRLPDYLIACVGGGSNAMGLFNAFLKDPVQMIGVEPGGRSFKPGDHAATLTYGKPGTIHGMFTYLLQNDQGQPLPVHSIASGLDYPGVGPQHSYLKDQARVRYVTANDKEALSAFSILSLYEGIIPALESAHALAEAIKLAPGLAKDKIIIVNLSGRGDKDVEQVARIKGIEL